MCGIVGIAGPGIIHWDLDVLRQLAYVSGLRGMDSTGVFQGKSNKNYFGKEKNTHLIEKSNIDVSFFMQFHKSFEGGNREVLSDTRNNFYCVHTRAATRGAISKDNAHPFEFSKYIGCHNGTLMDTKYSERNKTDSELLIKDINDNGIIPVLQKLDPGSAYVLVLYNKETGELTFARNNQRSLFVCFNQYRGVMYWASEKWMLEHIMARNNENILNDDIRFFEPNCVYTVHPSDIRVGTDAVFDKEKFTPKTFGHSYQGYKGVWNRDALENWSARQESKKKEEADSNEQSQKPNEKVSEDKDEKSDVLSTELILQHQQQLRTLPTTLIPRPRIVRTNYNNNNKIPVHYCCSCQRSMSLVDQYFATKFGEGTFIHKECMDEIPANIKANEDKHIG